MNNHYLIRKAKPNEAKSLTELAIRSKAYWGYTSDFIELCRDELTVSKQDINEAVNVYCVCEKAGALVGYFSLEPIEQHTYELEALFVEPKFIGSGCGTALLNEAKRIAVKLGAKTIFIQGEPHAKNFYLKSGAIQTGERESGSIPGRFLPCFELQLCQKHL